MSASRCNIVVSIPPSMFSASQVSAYELCNRKWAWRSIDGISTPSNASAQLGTEVHREIEHWLRDGEFNPSTKAGNIAFAGLSLLPQPKTGDLLVEEPFEISMGGHAFRGYIDARQGSTVYDHKTTTNFGWARTPEELRDDVQATLYAAVAMLRTGAPHADLQWTYFRTSGRPKAEAVRVRVTREEITPRLKATVRSADEMSQWLSSGLTAKDLPYNVKACEKYGGCPYLDRCSFPPSERLTSVMAQHVDIAAMLAGLKNGNAAAAAPQAPPGFPAGTPPGFQNTATAMPPPTIPTNTPFPWTPPAQTAPPVAPTPAAQPWTPPVAPAPAAQPWAPPVTTAPAAQPWAPPVTTAPAAQPWTPPTATTAPEPAPEPAKRGRPAKTADPKTAMLLAQCAELVAIAAKLAQTALEMGS